MLGQSSWFQYENKGTPVLEYGYFCWFFFVKYRKKVGGLFPGFALFLGLYLFRKLLTLLCFQLIVVNRSFWIQKPPVQMQLTLIWCRLPNRLLNFVSLCYNQYDYNITNVFKIWNLTFLKKKLPDTNTNFVHFNKLYWKLQLCCTYISGYMCD